MATFTAAQIAQIRILRDAGPINGNYSHIYEYIASILPAGSKEQRWFTGAAQANAGNGVFSVFIREYSKLQMALRGVSYTDTLMQNASNEVAINTLHDILGENPNTKENRRPDANGNVTAPTITEIALIDAVGVGQILFQSIPSDSAIKDSQNSAWSGTILFSALGEDQTWRLLNPKKDTAKFDTLDDLRNLLFARQSFYTALQAAVTAFVAEVPASIVDQLKLGNIPTDAPPDYLSALKNGQVFTDLGISIATALNIDYANAFQSNSIFGTFFPSSSPARAVVLALTDVTDVEVINMLRRSVLGNDMIPSTDATFNTDALAFFNQMGDTQQYGMELTSGSLATQAKTDFSAMAALNALSLFRFTDTTAVERLQNSNYALYIGWQQDQIRLLLGRPSPAALVGHGDHFNFLVFSSHIHSRIPMRNDNALTVSGHLGGYLIAA